MVERLRFISAGKHRGLPLEIRDLLAVWESGTCAQVKASPRPRITARLARAAQRVAELQAFTAALHGALEHLDALPDRAGRCHPGCGFLTVAPAARKPAELILSPGQHTARHDNERWRTAPVACSLPSGDMAKRAAWRDALDGTVRADIPDGLRLTVPAGRAAAIAELAVAEQQCCAFFGFRLHLDGPVLHLEVRAPSDAADLLATLFTVLPPRCRTSSRRAHLC